MKRLLAPLLLLSLMLLASCANSSQKYPNDSVVYDFGYNCVTGCGEYMAAYAQSSVSTKYHELTGNQPEPYIPELDIPLACGDYCYNVSNAIKTNAGEPVRPAYACESGCAKAEVLYAHSPAHAIYYNATKSNKEEQTLFYVCANKCKEWELTIMQ